MRVYIAGPYTKGDVVINVRNAIDAGDKIAKAGHHPFIPHLTHFWHFLHPGPWAQWISQDEEWLKVCHAVIRLPGESVGADGEVKVAARLGLPIYDSVESFLHENP